MLKSILLAGALLAAPAAQARTWYSVDMTQGLCAVFNFDGMTSPEAVMTWARTNGTDASFEENRIPNNSGGTDEVVIVNLDDHNGTPFSIPFFVSVDDCQKYLAAGQDSGVIIKPNMN